MNKSFQKVIVESDLIEKEEIFKELALKDIVVEVHERNALGKTGRKESLRPRCSIKLDTERVQGAQADKIKILIKKLLEVRVPAFLCECSNMELTYKEGNKEEATNY